MSTKPTSTRRPTASVVMITHNRRRLLERHLPTLLRDPAATEVIVVNDGSRDDTAELLERLARKHPQLVPVNIPNSGMDRARRTGVDHASGELLVLMDDDVEPTDSLITRHVERHVDRDDLVVVGYMPIERYDDLTGEALATATYATDYETVMRRYEKNPDRILFDLWNGHVSLRREAYLRARYGDDSWPRDAFFEDRHLGLQLQRLGLVGHFDRDVMGYHRHSGDLASFRRNARAMGYGNRLLHERHPDLLGAYDPDQVGLEDLPAAVALFVRLGDVRGATAITGLLERAARLAGRASLYHLQDRIARLMRRMELRIGARQRTVEARSGSATTAASRRRPAECPDDHISENENEGIDTSLLQAP